MVPNEPSGLRERQPSSTRQPTIMFELLLLCRPRNDDRNTCICWRELQYPARSAQGDEEESFCLINRINGSARRSDTLGRLGQFEARSRQTGCPCQRKLQRIVRPSEPDCVAAPIFAEGRPLRALIGSVRIKSRPTKLPTNSTDRLDTISPDQTQSKRAACRVFV